jgi:phospholipid/cholesterol/gamma-HCH transport system substrate-binding protein
MKVKSARRALAAVLALALVGGALAVIRSAHSNNRLSLTAYFTSTNGIYPGDNVRILGVPVGRIVSIEPQPDRAKVSFWIDDEYKLPVDVKAAILSPAIVTARAIQLTPVYSGGPTLQNNAVIPLNRTMVPVEWDDLRAQLDKLSQSLQPSRPDGVSNLGAFINSAADNLRGQGNNIHQSIVNLSQAISALGDHSGDLFGTVRNLAILVQALNGSTDALEQLNRNFAAITALLAKDPQAVGHAITDLNTAAADVRSFVSENRPALGTASDRLAEISTTLGQSLDDIKQALHVFPNTIANFDNIYQPAQGAITGVLAGTNFSNPINFICGAIQAASRLDAQQAAKLCVQYLAPIVKNRQYNFLGPIGFNFIVGASARPNEVTYSEDRLRPDYVPPATPAPGATGSAEAQGPEAQSSGVNPPQGQTIPAAEPGFATATDPATGLTGMMAPPGGGS